MTRGHVDIIKRAKQFCDKLVVAIGTNSGKKTFFTVEERLKQIDSVINDELDFTLSTDVSVISFPGLLVSAAQSVGAKIVVRGIRSVSDFEYELTLSYANKVLAPEIETIFLPTSPTLSVVSSSMVKEICSYGGDISSFVSNRIRLALEERVKR